MRIKSRFVIASCILASITGLSSPLYAADKAKSDETVGKGDTSAPAAKATAAAKSSSGKDFKAGVKAPLAQKIPQHFQEALIYQSMGLSEQAIGFYKQALKDDPSYVSTYNNMAQCYLDRGRKADRDEAKRLVEEALKISPNNVGSLHVTALISCQDERFEDAEKAYKEVLAIQPLNFRAVQNLSELYYYKLGQPQKARQLLKATLKKDPPEKEREVFVEALKNLDDLVKHKHKKAKVATKPAKKPAQ